MAFQEAKPTIIFWGLILAAVAALIYARNIWTIAFAVFVGVVVVAVLNITEPVTSPDLRTFPRRIGMTTLIKVVAVAVILALGFLPICPIEYRVKAETVAGETIYYAVYTRKWPLERWYPVRLGFGTKVAAQKWMNDQPQWFALAAYPFMQGAYSPLNVPGCEARAPSSGGGGSERQAVIRFLTEDGPRYTQPRNYEDAEVALNAYRNILLRGREDKQAVLPQIFGEGTKEFEESKTPCR